MKQKIKLRTKKLWVTCVCEERNGSIYLSTPFNKELIDEIKSMEQATWHGFDPKPEKVWSFPMTDRNIFNFQYLLGKNPYAHYEQPLVDIQITRPLYKHQEFMVKHILTYKRVIIAGEMGTGKTLAAIEGMERSGKKEWFWVGPRSALAAVQVDFDKWDAKIRPQFFTYEAIRRWVEEYVKGQPIPEGVVFDESFRIKTPTALRSQACARLAEMLRENFDKEAYIIEMSGSPAPKSPVDWWHQCEVACPGFIREGTPAKFKYKLAIILNKESPAGGVYPELVTWRSSEKFCDVCGELKEHENHDPINCQEDWFHVFRPSVNEVLRLYKRMRGLVYVCFKKDCLDLPDKQYRTVKCEMTQETARAATLIAKTSSRTIQALTLLRELSDGFQYVEEKVGEEDCPNCGGKGMLLDYFDPNNPDEPISQEALAAGKLEKKEMPCLKCEGTGKIPKFEQQTIEVGSPKMEALENLLDENEDVERIVIYAGFTASIDICVKLALKNKWNVIRVDGRGWAFFTEAGQITGIPDKDLLLRFQNKVYNERIAFIGHPESAGEGLTLTAACMTVYYSNDFKASNRIQSEDRIHRPGMDANRGAIIVDLIHLGTDELIINNLKKKRNLQELTMGEINETLVNV